MVNRYARARWMKHKQGEALEQAGSPVRRGGQAFAPHLDGDAGNLLVPERRQPFPLHCLDSRLTLFRADYLLDWHSYGDTTLSASPTAREPYR